MGDFRLSVTMTIGQATGFKVDRGGGHYIFLQRYDPFSKTWRGDGSSFNGPIHGPITDQELRERGIAIVPSPEELAQIEALRLTNRVARAAAELSNAISEWLHRPEAR